MTNTYKLAKIWLYMLIIPIVIFDFMFWYFILDFYNYALREVTADEWIFLVILAIFSGLLIYGGIKCKIVTSPETIDYLMLGIRVTPTWDKVERIDMNPFGIVNLVFKEPLLKIKIVNSLISPQNTLQLSPYIEDLATSNLLKDIAKYAPVNNIPEFVSLQNKKPSIATHQKPGVIGLYYFGSYLALSLITGDSIIEFLLSIGFQNAEFFTDLVYSSMLWGFLTILMRLIGYRRRGWFKIDKGQVKGYIAEIINLTEDEISLKARTYYLYPFTLIAVSLLFSIIVWIITKEPSRDLLYFGPVIGYFSYPISEKIVKLLWGTGFLSK